MVIEKQIFAMRGRDKTNPNYRGKANENFEQMLEPNSEGISNSLTTVQKDNMVLEVGNVEVRQATKEGSIPCKIGGGGRLELSQQPNTQRTSTREWRDKSNVDNGEYP